MGQLHGLVQLVRQLASLATALKPILCGSQIRHHDFYIVSSILPPKLQRRLSNHIFTSSSELAGAAESTGLRNISNSNSCFDKPPLSMFNPPGVKIPVRRLSKGGLKGSGKVKPREITNSSKIIETDVARQVLLNIVADRFGGSLG